MVNSYEIGTGVWQPDPTEGWISSEVKERTVNGDKVTIIFLLENGEVCQLRIGQVAPGLPTNHVDIG
jgi:myosin-5